VLSVRMLARIADAALLTLRASGEACTPPYRVTSDGAEYEWCLALCSEPLPPNAGGRQWLLQRLERNAQPLVSSPAGENMRMKAPSRARPAAG
jgi:hypothetical protein